MSPWSLKLLINEAMAEPRPPPSGEPGSRYVSLTECYEVALVAPATPLVVINFEVPSKLVSHQHFLAGVEACLSNMISFFNAEVTPATRAELSRKSGEIVAGNPSRRVLPLWLIVCGEIHLASADAVNRYLFGFHDTFSAVTVAGRAGSPVAVSAVASLVYVIRGRTEEEDQCSICLEALPDGDDGGDRRILRTPCMHVYHEHCIVPWLKRSDTCPLCRSQIPRCIHVEF